MKAVYKTLQPPTTTSVCWQHDSFMVISDASQQGDPVSEPGVGLGSFVVEFVCSRCSCVGFFFPGFHVKKINLLNL